MKKIAIVGAGVAGLTFAAFLEKKNFLNYRIYESKKKKKKKNAYGIQLSVNAHKILNLLNAKKFKKNNIFYPKSVNFYDIKTFNKISNIDLTQFNYKDLKYTCLKRSVLLSYLLNQINSKKILYGKKLVKIIKVGKKQEIQFSDGTSKLVDIIIGADGVNSTVNNKAFLENKIIYSNVLALRSVLKLNAKNKDLDTKNISIFMGPRIHMVIYPLNVKKEFNIVIMINSSKYLKFYNNKKIIFSKIKNFLNLDIKNGNNKILKLINKCYFDFWPIFETDDDNNWYKKNIVLLGDSAHAMLPSQSQGASQSIESAFYLSKSFHRNKMSLNNNFYLNRKKRIKKIKFKSRFNLLIFHFSNPLLIFIRNIFFKILMNNKFFLRKYLGDIYKT